MSRSLKKSFFLDNSLRKLLKKNNTIQDPSKKFTLEKSTFVWSRRSIIVPEFLGQNFHVHNGKGFIKIKKISENMIGHKFGEFAPTRKKGAHKKKK
jgi:small subunit ribosomal protein S19